MLSIASRLGRYAPCLSLAMFMGAAIMPNVAYAQENDPANPPVTAHLSGLSLKAALDLLSRSAGVNCALPPELAAKIDPGQIIDVNLTDGTFQDALNSVLDQVNPPLAFHIENGKYVLEASPTPRPHWGRKPPKNDTRPHGLTVSADKTPFVQALRQLFFFNREANYRVEPSVSTFLDPVTYSVADVPFDDALAQMLNAVPGQKTPLTFRKEKGAYVIALHNSVKANGAKTENTDKTADALQAIGLPSYHPTPMIQNVDVVDARPNVPLRQLFQQTDASYVLMLPNSVAAMPRVTFAMRRVPLEQAVVHLLRSAPCDPMLDLFLQPESDSPAEVKSLNGKPADAKPHLFYLVKPRWQDLAPVPLAGYRLTFRFQNANLYDALKTLLQGAGTSYILDPALRAIRASVSGDDLTADKAVARLLAASPKPLESKTENDILIVRRK